jgi:hypothetical protein
MLASNYVFMKSDINSSMYSLWGDKRLSTTVYFEMELSAYTMLSADSLDRFYLYVG